MRFVYEMLVASVGLLALYTVTALVYILCISIGQEKKMIKKLFYSVIESENFIIAACIALIIAGSIFGTWAMLQTL